MTPTVRSANAAGNRVVFLCWRKSAFKWAMRVRLQRAESHGKSLGSTFTALQSKTGSPVDGTVGKAPCPATITSARPVLRWRSPARAVYEYDISTHEHSRPVGP